MNDDFIKASGTPFIAHRLKRLSEHIVTAIGCLIEAKQLDVPPTAGSTLLVLAAHERAGVMEIAERLRVSHPFIVRVVAKLEALGLITIKNDRDDLRRKWLTLTEKGRAEAAHLNRLNRDLDVVFRRVFEEAGVDLLDAVDRFEAALAREPLAGRLQSQLSSEDTPCVR